MKISIKVQFKFKKGKKFSILQHPVITFIHISSVFVTFFAHTFNDNKIYVNNLFPSDTELNQYETHKNCYFIFKENSVDNFGR